MKLYILRHGHSPSILEAKVANDAERPLSASGRQAARKAAELIAARGGKPGLILHSPLRRAAETAAAAAAVLKPAQVEPFLPLSNVMDARGLAASLRARASGSEEMLIVGHQPQLGELVAHLSNGTFNIPPAGLVALDVPDGGPAAVLFHDP